jgi:CheY-like chemotaxis protein
MNADAHALAVFGNRELRKNFPFSRLKEGSFACLGMCADVHSDMFASFNVKIIPSLCRIVHPSTALRHMAPVVLFLRCMRNGPKKVLVVEDNSDWRLLLSMVIQRAGYDVISATNGREGVARALLEQPNLILMDLGLPELSGDQATAQIKANEGTKHIPVVIQTAFGTGPSAQRAIDAGAAEILHKPVAINAILATLKKYLSAGLNTSTVSHPLNTQASYTAH